MTIRARTRIIARIVCLAPAAMTPLPTIEKREPHTISIERSLWLALKEIGNKNASNAIQLVTQFYLDEKKKREEHD